MPYLTPKPKQAGAWLPSQVDYGIDCSDPDPKNWTAFGKYHDQLEAQQQADKPKKNSASE